MQSGGEVEGSEGDLELYAGYVRDGGEGAGVEFAGGDDDVAIEASVGVEAKEGHGGGRITWVPEGANVVGTTIGR